MTGDTYQMKVWKGEFGKEYTDRNVLGAKGLDSLYERNFGITRTKLNSLFIGRLSRNLRILEVGSNMGNQLLVLKEMGFTNLYGIEINSYAVGLSREKSRDINIIQGSALDIPYKDGYFDLVFTAGVLIHIPPRAIKTVMREIYRSSRAYIWGFEYYAEKYTRGKTYRGHNNLFWKANFARLYTDLFGNLKLVKEKKLKYKTDENVDSMFLLKK